MASKTMPSPVSVGDFLAAVEPPGRRDEGLRLDAIFCAATGFLPRMWGPTMVGYGRYRYRYASGREGECFATGFSPRKAALSIYILPGYADFSDILAGLGRHKLGKSCLYLRHLADADEAALVRLIRAGLADLGRRWPVLPT